MSEPRRSRSVFRNVCVWNKRLCELENKHEAICDPLPRWSATHNPIHLLEEINADDEAFGQ